jgi:tetratricopeptide (TPR) repeat protein
MTELGVVGFIAYIFLMFRVLKNGLKYLKGVMKRNYAYNYMLVGIMLSILIIFIEQLFVPSNFLQLFLLFTLLACISQYMITRQYTETSRILFYILSVAGVLSVITLFYTLYTTWMAEFYMQRSVYAIQAKNTKGAYEDQQKAVITNPNIDKLQSIFAQTNILYAISLSQKKDLSDQEKQTITQLAAAAAQEGKNAVSLNPYNVQNWENLAGVYRAMIGSVKEADVWTVQSYNQALRLDPTNPNLYLATGGVYFAAKNYDTAINLFAQAARLKPDYANAYYNLAAAYREKKDWGNAAQAMQLAIANVPNNSPDKKKAETELEEIKKNVPKAESTGGQQLEDASQTEEKLTTPVNLDAQKAAPNIQQNKTAPLPQSSNAPSAIPSPGQ